MAVAVTTVNEALDNSETGVDIINVLGFPQSGAYTVRVDSEWMRVTSGAGTTTWTVTRGYNSTTAATHDTGVAIYHVPDSYADLSRVKNYLAAGGAETTADDDILVLLIDAVQSYMVSRLGMFLGPTTETSLTMDGEQAMTYMGRKASRLRIPFGIQTLTSVTVAPQTGGTAETITAADLISGPRFYESRLDPNQPITTLTFKDVVAGNWNSFPSGVSNIVITGTLGWSEPPNRLGELADTMVIRMGHASQSGQRDLVGTDQDGLPLVSRFISSADHQVLRTFWGEISGHQYI